MDVVHTNKLNLTLRVAGGWVRDKLLKAEMKKVDIDIALDTMLGREFAELVNDWLEKHHKERHSVGIIQRNPDQSKHLETARMMVYGLWIDLVNLRTEKYTHDSRIPVIEIGTPYEDAMRRDLTINACFYNVNNNTIEDYTGRGLSDMKKRSICTPLPPLTTLLDDPLRALRSIRFASRLNFSVDPALSKAVSDVRVHQALLTKVSRERVGTEVDLMVSSKKPLQALGLICELGLFDVVFQLPDASRLKQPVSKTLACEAMGCLINLDSILHHHMEEKEPLTEEEIRIARFSAFTAPVAGHMYTTERNRVTPVAKHILQDQLRIRSKDVEIITKVHAASLQFRSLVNSTEWSQHLAVAKSAANEFNAVQIKENADHLRLKVAMILRRVGLWWRLALMISLILELSPACVAQTYAEGVFHAPNPLDEESNKVVARYYEFEKYIEGLELHGVWDMKPFFDGNALRVVLPSLPGGPAIGETTDTMIKWQILNPKQSREGCELWLKAQFPKYAGANSQ